jgi:hypothetical protein
MADLKFFRFPKNPVSVMIYVNGMQRKQLLFVKQLVSYNGSYAP